MLKKQFSSRLLTNPSSGLDNLYDTVCACTRCGACQQVCPRYQETPLETVSPRGQNQLLRALLERKLKLTDAADALADNALSCTLCGQCTLACAGKVPTAQHVVEVRRALQVRTLPCLLHALLNLRSTSPRFFAFLLHGILWLRRIGLVALLRGCGITRLPFLQWVNYADTILPKRARFFTMSGKQKATSKKKLVYLPSLEAQYFLPQLAETTLQLALHHYDCRVWLHMPCGLFDYLYGDLHQCRHTVKRLISRHQQEQLPPVLTDSIDVFRFLQQMPRLFARYPRWQKKAQQLAERVLFVTDLLPKKLILQKDFPLPVTLLNSTILAQNPDERKNTETILTTLFKQNFINCNQPQPFLPAGGYCFTPQADVKFFGKEAVERLAAAQTKTVVVLSGLAQLEIEAHLRQLYPCAQALHIAEIGEATYARLH